MREGAILEARRFVEAADLPDWLPATLSAVGSVEFDFDGARQNAAVVGSDVIAFAKCITPEQRSDVVNATLLAQLVAKKAFPDPRTLPEVLSWYDRYFDTLSRVGFVTQDMGFSEYAAKGDTFETHQAIIEIATTLLAGSPAAVVIVKKTLEALQKMAADSPWITLFHRESQSANTARVQMSLVDADENAPFLVSTIAFGLEAESRVAQVLFFRFHKNRVKLRHHTGKATISAEVLAGVRDQVRAKVVDFSKTFVAGLEV
jgi:hypothetical protein